MVLSEVWVCEVFPLPRVWRKLFVEIIRLIIKIENYGEDNVSWLLGC